jgi:hypothetical protein
MRNEGPYDSINQPIYDFPFCRFVHTSITVSDMQVTEYVNNQISSDTLE